MTPSGQPFPPASPYHDKSFPVPERDIAKAKALLKEAGVETVSFEMQVANIDHRAAARPGRPGDGRRKPASTSRSDRPNSPPCCGTQRPGNFQVDACCGWSGRVDPDGNIHQFVTTRAAGSTTPKYSNAEVDKAAQRRRAAIYDVAERAEAL